MHTSIRHVVLNSKTEFLFGNAMGKNLHLYQLSAKPNNERIPRENTHVNIVTNS